MWRLPVIVNPLPYQLANGQTANAPEIMTNMNSAIADVNANAAGLANTARLNAANSFTLAQSGLAATMGSAYPIASQVQNLAFRTLSSVGGTANAITGRVAALPLSNYVRGQMFTFAPTLGNSGVASLNIDSVGATAIRAHGTAGSLDSGMLEAFRVALVRMAGGPEQSGSAFQVINPAVTLGGWLPTITFSSPGDLAVTYTTRAGFWLRVQRLMLIWFDVLTATFIHTTASGSLRLTGTPAGDPPGVNFFGGALIWRGVTAANYAQVAARPDAGNILLFFASGSGQVVNQLDAADVPSGGTVRLSGFVAYPTDS